MIRVFLGTDAFSRQRALEEAVSSALGVRHSDPLARQIFYAGESGEEIVGRVIEACSTVSLFSPELAVIVRRIEALKSAEHDQLIKWLESGPECLLFLEGEKIDGRTEFAKQLKKLATIETFDAPPLYKMPEWITQHCAKAFRCKIQTQAAQYLSDALGNDPALVHAEIAKIRLHSPHHPEISLEEARLLVVQQREMATFEIQKPFGDRDTVTYMRTLRQLLHRGVDPIPIISALYQHGMRLIHVQALSRQGKSESEMAQMCGMVPWVFSKVQNLPRQAEKWPPKHLHRTTTRLSEMAFELKIGKYQNTADLENALYALLLG